MRALGLVDSPLWRVPIGAAPSLSAPIEAQLIVTTRCTARCDFCSVDASEDGFDMAVDEARRILTDLAARGVFTVAFGGGEPLLHASLVELATYAKSLGMHATVTTSGLVERDLSIFDAVHVSLRPNGARALKRLAHPNLGLNVLLEHDHLDDLERAFDLAERHRLRAVQLLRIKPAGRAHQNFMSRDLDQDDERHVVDAAKRAVQRGLRVRVDCALAPLFDAPSPSTLAGAVTTIFPSGAQRNCVVEDKVPLVSIGNRSDIRRRGA
jgi:pyrroloquinoline quinone biosynthesis protein E